jgi:LDH2 family malate/lactate/ureidoglycolate dehydrogenase
MANTAVARGKVYLARQKGAEIPPGWAIDAAGEPTTDPHAALAGHNGYAISPMMDVLAGVLTGSAFGAEVGGPYQTDRRSGAGHLFIALNVEAFTRRAEFDARMEQLIAGLKSTPRAKGVEEIHYPGELEDRNERRHRRDGLVLPAQTVKDRQISALATLDGAIGHVQKLGHVSLCLRKLARETGVELELS